LDERPVFDIINPDIEKDGRRCMRFSTACTVYLRFGSNAAWGDLLNIGLGGLVSAHKGAMVLPQVGETLLADLEFPPETRIEGLSGLVVRSRTGEDALYTGPLECAVMFKGLPPEKERELRVFLALLMKREEGCPYFDLRWCRLDFRFNKKG